MALKTVKNGNKGSEVKILQYVLGVSPDGIFGPKTLAALKTWQRARGLTADGICGKKTWAKVAEYAPTIKLNSKGGYVYILEILLETMNQDGVYTSDEYNHVKTYQTAKGLVADGIVGKKTWGALFEITSTSTSKNEAVEVPTSGKFVQPVDYKQGDSRWGKIVYTSCGNNKQTIANSGCVPTAMANIVATLIDPKITPPDLAELAVKWGDRTKSSGTAWSFYDHIKEHFGFSKFVQTTSLTTLKACLDGGGYAVASMAPGYWTSGGHFITIWKQDDTYIYANDPASSKRTKQKTSQFVKERKQYFCFWK